MKTQLVVVLGLTLAFVGSHAEAGPLNDINRDISDRQAQGDRASTQPSSQRPTEHYDSADRNRDREDERRYRAETYILTPTGSVRVRRRSRYGAPIGAKVGLDATLGYQNVVDSGGAFNADLRLSHGLVAVGFSSSSFFESGRFGKGEPDSEARLTRWELSLQGKAIEFADRTKLWVGVGVGMLHGSGFKGMTGLSARADLTHQLSDRMPGGLGIKVGARGMMYPDDINAREFSAGFTASVLHVGYRYLEFNVGEPLRGPEAGIALQF